MKSRRRVWIVSVACVAAALFGAWSWLGWVFNDEAVPRLAPGDRFVNAGGIRMRYRIVGSGEGEPTIVLLHGFGGKIESWGGVPDAMHCGRAVVFDLPGFGASDRPDVSYDLDSQRRRVLAALDSLGIERAVFAGASMGGAVAALTAARSPERVMGLALFAPAGVPGLLELPGAGGWVQNSRLLSAIARELTRVPIYGLLFPDNLARQALTVTASYNAAFVAALDSIRAPTVLVWSPGDPRVPFAASRTYLEAIRGSRLVTAPAGAGHDLLADSLGSARIICDLVQHVTGVTP